MEVEAFPNYTQLTPRLPAALWWVLRGATLLLTLFIIYLLMARPETGLVVFWKLLVPLLPISFAVIPGLWRNICPMALLNQLPRKLGLSRENTLSDNLRKLALYLSVLAFIVFVLLRHPVLNQHGFYLGLILLSALVMAFAGGLLFKGRSGWCGTFCPLAPLQKAYGHAPLILVRNGYCEPCLGCQKNCYDFNPRAAIFSDLNDADGWWSEHRKFFIALLPGLIVGFFNSSYSDEVIFYDYLLSMLIPMGLSIGLFYSLHNLLHINFYKLASVFAMTALAIFYWYGTPLVAAGLQQLFSITLPATLITSIQVGVIVLSLTVIIRGLMSEHHFKQSQQTSSQASLGEGVSALKAALGKTGQLVQVKEQSSGMQLLLRQGQTLLDALEDADLPIMPGCRMGMCGSDPVVVTDGFDNLNPPEDNELNTLRRLGLEGKARLACCCKPKAGISIDLEADPTQLTLLKEDVVETEQENNRQQIIIVGNGIAGISTAETLRELDSDCRIILITREPHHFYNRMGLEKVLYGRTAMQGLYLMKEEWYERNDIDFWLNTQVIWIDAKGKNIKLGTGESVNYDKLVLATGAKAFVPEQDDYQLAGVFTLRSAEDAVLIRSWVQQHAAKRAIVLGGGVLGIEAAEALLQLGLSVSLVHTDGFLMNRQLDKKSSTILDTFLRNKGIRVFTNNGISQIQASGDDLKRVLLNDRKILIADIILLCIGVRSDIELARKAGLQVNRGIIVDDQMQTSDPHIFCVGDAAELAGAMGGLWSVGSEQGKIAADVLAGGSSRYQSQSLPPVQLKVSGIDLKSFGSFGSDTESRSLYAGSNASNRWCHVSVKEGRLVAGAFVNSPLAANAAISASRKTDQVLSDQDIQDMLHKDVS